VVEVGEQGEHKSCASRSVNVSAAHGTHVMSAVRKKRPAGQGTQSTAPDTCVVHPGEQAVQLTAPVVLEKRPTGQRAQLDCCGAEAARPSGQSEHTAAPATLAPEKRPAAQGRQVD
jgi:hypothetical protein